MQIYQKLACFHAKEPPTFSMITLDESKYSATLLYVPSVSGTVHDVDVFQNRVQE